MNDLAIRYCMVSLIESIAVILMFVAINYIPQNKTYLQDNKIPCLMAIPNIICAPACILNVVITDGSTDYVISFATLMFFVSSMLTLYTLALLICAVYMCVKRKKTISDLRFARSGEFIKRVTAKYRLLAAKKVTFCKRILVILIPAMSLTYTIAFFGVWESFFANLSDWKFVLVDIALPSVVSFLIIVAVITLVGALFFRGDTCKLFAGLLGMICMISYIQNIAFNDNQILDGSPIDYKHNIGLVGLFNLLLWFTLCIVAIILCVKIEKCSRYFTGAAATLLVMQLVPTFVMVIQAPEKSIQRGEQTVYELDGASQYELSSDENVIVLIMDTLAESDIANMLDTDSDFCELFSDFFYYDNVSTESFYTAFSMPSLLTAAHLDFTESMVDSNRDCWNSGSAEYFYNTMHENGFHVRLYTDSPEYCGGVDNMLGKIDNTKMMTFESVTDGTATYFAMLKLSLYKYVPNYMKLIFMIGGEKEINSYTHRPYRYEFDYSDWSATSIKSAEVGISSFNHDIYNGITNEASVTSNDKLCVFMHTWGMHTPYYLNKELEAGDVSDAQRLNIQVAEAYIMKLKEIGAYDNSTIIVTADHGMHSLSGCTPAMMIKPKGHHSDKMIYSDVPGVLQMDLLPTILDCIGADYDALGASLLKLDSDTERERYVMDFQQKDEFPPCPKITAFGYASYNCYDKYLYGRRSEDAGALKYVGTYPIKDYWW